MSNKLTNCVTAKQSEMIKKVKGILYTMPKEKADHLTKKATLILRTKRAAANLVKGLTNKQRAVFYKLAQIAVKSAAPRQQPAGPLRSIGRGIMSMDDAAGRYMQDVGDFVGTQGANIYNSPVIQEAGRDFRRAGKDLLNIPTDIANTGTALGTAVGNAMFTPQGGRLLDPEAQAAYDRTQGSWNRQIHHERYLQDQEAKQQAARQMKTPNLAADPALAADYKRLQQVGGAGSDINPIWGAYEKRRLAQHQDYRKRQEGMDDATRNKFNQFMQLRARQAREAIAPGDTAAYMEGMQRARAQAMRDWRRGNLTQQAPAPGIDPITSNPFAS